MNCVYCGKSLANNDEATKHAGECEVVADALHSKWVENDFGVMGEIQNNGQFVPSCCFSCKNIDAEYSEWTYASYYYCTKNIFMPTRKGTCKKQEAQ